MSLIVDQIISVDDFPIELNGSTINSGDDFVVYTNDGNDTLAGYFTNDVIYKITIGFSDEDGDGENDEGINLFVDMCRNGVDFDASIAIIKSAGIDCKNIDGEELINNYVDGSWGESIDANALCPSAEDFSPPAYLPIARDINLDEQGDYYIVVDGHSSESFGNFSIVIGEMLHFTEYDIHPQNIFIDVNFSDFVYGVNDGLDWSIGTIENYEEYFHLEDLSGVSINVGTLIDDNGNTLQQNTGYNKIRFPLIDQPNGGSTVLLTVEDHLFLSADNNANAPHLVNSEGIPFSVGDTMYIDLNDIEAPGIFIEGISVENNTSIVDPDDNILISSTESLFQDGNIITAENLAGYLNLTFFEGGEQIPFNIEVNNDQTEIEIDPAISLVDYQWQDVVITFSNQNVDGDSLTDEASNLIQSETKNIRINDIINPLMSDVDVDAVTNALINVTMSNSRKGLLYKNLSACNNFYFR